MHIVSYMIFKIIIGLQLHLFHQACHLLQRQEHPMLSKHLESNIYFETTFSGPPKYLGNKFSLQKIYQAFSDKPLGFSTWWLPFLLPAPSKVSYKTTMHCNGENKEQFLANPHLLTKYIKVPIQVGIHNGKTPHLLKSKSSSPVNMLWQVLRVQGLVWRGVPHPSTVSWC